jgi:hypothetical protein
VTQPTIFLALLACIAASGAEAQKLSSRTRVWGAVGAGAGVPRSGGDGITNMAQLVFEKQSHHAAIRGLVLHDIERPTKAIGEVGVLYGWTRAVGRARLSLASGLSGVAFDTCPDDDDSCFTLGAPLVSEITAGGRFVGLGFQTFGNINGKASYAGGVLFLQLGRLR